MIKHLAFEIKEEDIHDFYMDVLGGHITRQFTLEKTDAEEIFSINKRVQVYGLNTDDLEFELFVADTDCGNSFRHLCLQVDDAEKMYRNAVKNEFRTHVRKSNDRISYFLKDRNNNTFEIKQKP
jgi:hypothetical protein